MEAPPPSSNPVHQNSFQEKEKPNRPKAGQQQHRGPTMEALKWIEQTLVSERNALPATLHHRQLEMQQEVIQNEGRMQRWRDAAESQHCQLQQLIARMRHMARVVKRPPGCREGCSRALPWHSRTDSAEGTDKVKRLRYFDVLLHIFVHYMDILFSKYKKRKANSTKVHPPSVL